MYGINDRGHLIYNDVDLGHIEDILNRQEPIKGTECVIDCNTGELLCKRCGKTARFNAVMPLSAGAVIAYINNFARDHEGDDCESNLEGDE
jgi:hypothetical protein